jgi:hypothetical protein
MPSRRGFRRPLSEERHTSNHGSETTEYPSSQTNSQETSFILIFPPGTRWKDLIKALFQDIDPAEVEGAALEKLEWGEYQMTTRAIMAEIKERLGAIEPGPYCESGGKLHGGHDIDNQDDARGSSLGPLHRHVYDNSADDVSG